MSETVAGIDKRMALAEWRIEDVVRRDKGEHTLAPGVFDLLMADSVIITEIQPADLSAVPSVNIKFSHEGSPTLQVIHTPGGDSGYAYGRDKIKAIHGVAKIMLFNDVADGLLGAQHHHNMTPVDQQG